MLPLTRAQERALRAQVRAAYPRRCLTWRDYLAGLSELVYPIFLAFVLGGWSIILMIALGR